MTYYMSSGILRSLSNSSLSENTVTTSQLSWHTTHAATYMVPSSHQNTQLIFKMKQNCKSTTHVEMTELDQEQEKSLS